MDAAYRIAVLVVFFGAMSIGVYHRWRAHSGEKFDRRQEGLALAVVLRLAGLVLWVAAILFLAWPAAIAWAQAPLADWLRWSGAAFGLAGIGMMYWTMTNLGKNLTDTVATRADATLVTSGPYRYVRHPFYVTAALLMIAAALLSANWLIAASGFAVIALLVMRTSKEEQKLVEKFGDAYREYMARTGRFLPRFGARG
jgi:protein-S-isoprenylcysteine O-methyltransferase Ste14